MAKKILCNSVNDCSAPLGTLRAVWCAKSPDFGLGQDFLDREPPRIAGGGLRYRHRYRIRSAYFIRGRDAQGLKEVDQIGGRAAVRSERHQEAAEALGSGAQTMPRGGTGVDRR